MKKVAFLTVVVALDFDSSCSSFSPLVHPLTSASKVPVKGEKWPSKHENRIRAN